MDAHTLIEEYRGLRPQYEAFTASLDALVRTLLNAAGIEFFAVEPRTKSLESFDGKIVREDKAGKYRTAVDVTDLSGVRIIAYLQEDCDRIETLIKDSFQVDSENSVRKEDELDPDKFGYLSTHYVVGFAAERLKLLEFSRFRGMKAEIQIRTLLQHTWAAIDWKFRYKEEQEAPKSLRRRLFRISALLEAADNEFSAVNTAINELRERYSQDISKGDLRINLNSESLRTFVAESRTAQEIIRIAQVAGVRLSPKHEGEAPYRSLISVAGTMEIETLHQLDAALERALPRAREFFELVVKKRSEEEGELRTPQLFGAAMLRMVLVLVAPEDKFGHLVSGVNFAPTYAEALRELRTQSNVRRKKAS